MVSQSHEMKFDNMQLIVCYTGHRFPSLFRSDHCGDMGDCHAQQRQAEVHAEDQPRLRAGAGDRRGHQEEDPQHAALPGAAEDVCAGIPGQVHPQGVRLR